VSVWDIKELPSPLMTISYAKYNYAEYKHTRTPLPSYAQHTPASFNFQITHRLRMYRIYLFNDALNSSDYIH
jgi:hypothetical protein